PCIALTGVENWRGTGEDGGKLALPEWDDIALNRTVLICYDSDVMQKPPVYRALVRFKRWLDYRGARTLVAYLPTGPNGEKVGLDDFLVAGHTRQDLYGLATDVLKPPPDDDEPDHPYRVFAGGFVLRQETQFGPQEKRLTNFLARIDGDLAEDDGVEVRH